MDFIKKGYKPKDTNIKKLNLFLKKIENVRLGKRKLK
jgi:hypothetical protein